MRFIRIQLRREMDRTVRGGYFMKWLLLIMVLLLLVACQNYDNCYYEYGEIIDQWISSNGDVLCPEGCLYMRYIGEDVEIMRCGHIGRINESVSKTFYFAEEQELRKDLEGEKVRVRWCPIGNKEFRIRGIQRV